MILKRMRAVHLQDPFGFVLLPGRDQGLGQGELDEVAFFDTFPGDNSPVFEGAWSVYPFFAHAALEMDEHPHWQLGDPS